MANVKIKDTNTVNLDADGDAITADVILNPDPNNLLSAGPDGLNAYYPLLSNPTGLNGTPPTEPGPLIYIDDSVDPECVMIWSCGSSSYLPFGGPAGMTDGVITGISDPDTNGIVTVTTSNGDTYTFDIGTYVNGLPDTGDGVVTGVAGPDTDGVITITMSDGSTFTVDVSTFVDANDNYVNGFTGPDANGNITFTYEDGRPPEVINILQYVLSHSCTPEHGLSFTFPTPYTVNNLGSGTAQDPDDPTPDCCPEVPLNYTFPNQGDTSDLLRAIVDQADQAARAYAYNLLSTA